MPDDTERALLQEFAISLTNGGRNATNVLSIDHDALLALVGRAKVVLRRDAKPREERAVEDFLVQLRRVNAERWAAWAGSDAPDPLYQSNEFGGEAGEIQNVVKKLVRESRGWRGSRATVQDLADEIADGIICLDSLARSYGIDLAAAVVGKFNATSEKQGFPHKLAFATEQFAENANKS